MRGAAGEHLRIDIPFLGPDAREGVQAVGHGLAEDHHVRGDAEILETPELAGTVEAHLDFVVHEHDLALVEDLLEARVIAVRRDHIAARALDAFHIERGVFGFPGLGVPHAVIFGACRRGSGSSTGRARTARVPRSARNGGGSGRRR